MDKHTVKEKDLMFLKRPSVTKEKPLVTVSNRIINNMHKIFKRSSLDWQPVQGMFPAIALCVLGWAPVATPLVGQKVRNRLRFYSPNPVISALIYLMVHPLHLLIFGMT